MIFQMDLGEGWEDITHLVRDNFGITEAACSPEYEYAKNTLDFTLNYDEDLFTRLHTILDYVYVRVLEDDLTTPVFRGRFVPCVGLVYNGVLDIQQLSLSVEDYTSMLDVTMEEFVTEDMYILNPADTTHSIIHVLFTHLGLSHSLIDSSVSILDTVGAAVADDDTNALDFVSTLLYEYGWVPNWSAIGLFSPIRWIQEESASTVFTFNDDNIIGQIEESPKELDKEGAKVYWYGLAEREDTRVYTEDLKWDEDGDFEGYPILRETFYPDEANVIDETTGTYQVVEQEYTETGIRYGANKYIEAGYSQDFALEHADFTRILVTKNHTIGDRYDAGLMRDTTIFGNKKAQIRYWNPMITSRQLYYMHIDADITYTKSRNTTKVEYVTNTKKIKEYDSSFLFDATYADRLAKAMAMSMRLGRYTYKITSEEKVAEGAYVGIVVSNGIIATGLVLERAYDGLTGLYSYTIRSYDTSYMPVVARTVRLSSLSADDAIGMISATNKSPVFSIEGDKEFSYYVGESAPVNTSLVLTATPSDPYYEVSSYQWYYRTEAGVDTEIVGATASHLTVSYDESWFYPGVPVICDINGKYSFTTTVKNTYNASYLGDYASDPDYAMAGDWYFYTGTTGGGRTQYTMYLWSGTEWIEDTYPSHNAEVYDLISSVSALTLYSGGVFLPSSVTLTSKRKVGMASYYDYEGRFTVEEARTDSTYSGVYASSDDESFHVFPPSGTISSLRFRLYEAGGFTELLDEYILPVTMSASTIEAMAPRYWGALEDAPTDIGVHINDYYFDTNTAAEGGGKIRYWTGLLWAEMPTDHFYYATALKTAMTDLMVWASAQGETVAAANAIFQSIAVADAFISELTSRVAFIESLFAQQIEVPDGGRIRYYNGQGVQKRCVQLAEDRVDWLDTPDTTPASDELLVGRIGRLGVASPILLDGEFCVGIEPSWSAESVINPSSSYYSAYIQLSDGELRIAYPRSSDGYLVERIWSGSTWGAESVINPSASSDPAYIQLSTGELRIVYRRIGDGYLVERIWSGSTWGAESVINGASSFDPAYIQLSTGELRIVYQRGSDGYLVERIWSGSTWGAESVINPSASSDPAYIQLSTGELRIVYSRASDFYLCERIWSGSTWGAESVINGASSFAPTYIQLPDDELRIAYRRGSDGYLVERIWSGSTWGAESVINPSSSSDPAYIQLSTGELRIAYRRTGDGYLVERALQRYAQLGAGIIESGSNANGYYQKFSNGTMMQWGTVSGNCDIIFNSNIGTYGWSFYYGNINVTFPEEFVGAYPNVFSTSYDETGTGGPVSVATYNLSKTSVFLEPVHFSSRVGIFLSWLAIGRWK